MRTKSLRIAAVAAFVLVVQQVLMTRWHLFGVHPDLLLLFALCVGITGGRDRGALAGFAAGFASDVFLPSPLGLSALTYAIAAFFVGTLSDDANELPWVVSVLAMFGTAVALVAFVLVGAVTGNVRTSPGHVVQVVLVVALVNGVLAPFITRGLRNAWSPRSQMVW